jgi:hypothetical protein
MSKGLIIALSIAAAVGFVILVSKKNTPTTTIVRTIQPAATSSLGTTEGILQAVGNNIEGLLGVTPQASGPGAGQSYITSGGASYSSPSDSSTLTYGPTDAQLGIVSMSPGVSSVSSSLDLDNNLQYADPTGITGLYDTSGDDSMNSYV